MMHLVLFFTRGMSIKAWDDVGMFDREVALYEKLRDKDVSITFVTYGSSDDLDFQERLTGIEILCNRWGLPIIVYEKLLHRVHGKALRSCDLIKTNQMNGADSALRCSQHWGKPLIARCGWMVSFNEGKKHGYDSEIAKKSRLLEKNVFSQADYSIVTTEKMHKDVVSRIPEIKKRILVIPNYVDETKFLPDLNSKKNYDVIFVGRLSPEKNIAFLLSGFIKSNLKLLMIGQGPLGYLVSEHQVNSIQGKINWIEKVPNSDLPKYFNSSKIFILPSLYENHPKALIEAMACGLPVIGADSPGIRELIDHGVNGYLCGTDSESIFRAIEELLSKPELCQKMGQNARQYVVENFSLDRIAEMEYSLYQDVLRKENPSSIDFLCD